MPLPEDTAPARPVGALIQALRVLRHLAASGTPQGVTQIARATGLNGSTCFHLLRTLSTEGLLVFDPLAKTYRPGLGLVELAVGVLGANPGDLIRPEMERLAQRHGALICLWHLTQTDRIVLIERAFDPRATRVDLPLGKRLPALIGAVGRVIAAHRIPDAAGLRDSFARLRWQSAPFFEAWASDVAAARTSGYGVDLGNLYLGVDSVGALITDARGIPRYGLSSVTLAGQTDETTRHAIGHDLAQTCRHVSRALFTANP